MALRDIFKRKKPEKKPEKAIEEKPVEVKPPKVKKKIKVGQAYRIIKIPHVTEKASYLVRKNQYVFKVWPRANKTEIKKAIEDVFGVEVKGVRIVNIPKKKRRLGRIEGFRKGYKKAIVKIKEGQKIEVLPR
jgi:large subunit ribosomal protein L23